MPTPYAKQPVAVPDQIALLRGRGQEIKDVDRAEGALTKGRYYRFSEHWRLVRESEVVEAGKGPSCARPSAPTPVSLMSSISTFSTNAPWSALRWRPGCPNGERNAGRMAKGFRDRAHGKADIRYESPHGQIRSASGLSSQAEDRRA